MDPHTPTSGAFELQPFRAVRLTDTLVGNVEANRFFARPYRSMPGRLRDWRRQRRLKVDLSPALYLHEFTSDGVTVRGIVGALDLRRVGETVAPHEGVTDSQVEQLANRMEAMSLNPAPILLMHRSGPATRAHLQEATAKAPDISFTDRSGQVHRIWRIVEDAAAELGRSLLSTDAVIADGHHRYAAARRLQTAHEGSGWDRTLVMLVDEGDNPLQLGAIHRSVPGLRLDTIEGAAQVRGDEFRRHPGRDTALAGLEHHLVLHDGQSWATLAPGNRESLLVCALHQELLPAWQVSEDRLEFHHTAASALARAGSGVAVLLPAPTYDQVAASARSGALLPPKATSFQPKPHLGSIMRDVRDG